MMQITVFMLYGVGALCFFFGTLINWWLFVEEKAMPHLIFGMYTVGALCFFVGTMISWWMYNRLSFKTS